VSVAVSLDRLREEIDGFGARAYLVTVSPDGRAHVVSVLVRLEDEELVASCGSTSRANATVNPSVTVLWPPVADGRYGLIVDGTARVEDASGTVVVRPSRAVLHRVADGGDDIPKCIPLE
jgi:hypothetical protein